MGLIRGVGAAPKITYELVHIYPHRDGISENGTGAYPEPLTYRVTLVQHWMFPPNGYIDTDYVSLDVDIRPEPHITARNAGRGSFVLDSNPDAVEVVEFDGKNWRGMGVKTPLNDFINAGSVLTEFDSEGNVTLPGFFGFDTSMLFASLIEGDLSDPNTFPSRPLLLH